VLVIDFMDKFFTYSRIIGYVIINILGFYILFTTNDLFQGFVILITLQILDEVRERNEKD